MFDGQSLMTTPTGLSASIKLFAVTGGNVTTPNHAVAATTYATRAGTQASRYGATLNAHRRSTVLDLGGQSDLWADMSAATLYAAALSYWNTLRAAGADFIVPCTIPHALNFQLAPTQNAERLAYNALLRASTDVDDVVDVAADPRFANPQDTTYFADGLHPTEAGAQVIAELADAVLRPLLRY